jgi:hypothetical protein
MLGVFRSASAESRSAAARLGLAALLACVGLTWTAGASNAFATWGTVTIKKVNQGGDQTDRFRFAGSTAIAMAGDFWVTSGGRYSSSTVHANAGRYDAPAYTVTEDATAAYELKAISCTVTAAPYKPKYGSATPSLADRKVAIKVGVGENVTCVFTNQRKTGTIKVVKKLAPATDGGRFDLQVDGTTVKAAAGDGGYGTVTVAPGVHTVGEVAGTAGVSLDDYVRSTRCTKAGADGPTAVPVGDGAISVGANDDITCTIENVRKATIVVRKHTAPADTATDRTAFDFTLAPGGPFTLTDGGVRTETVAPGQAYTVAEGDPRAKAYRLTALECTRGTTDLAARTATVTPGPGETVTCDFTNTKLAPGIQIVKSGPAFAYSGDTLDFRFAVTNTGEVPLTKIQVGDDRCAPVEGPEKPADDTDDVLAPGETWQFTCTMVAPAHAIGDANPVVNVATAQGEDAEGRKVEDRDEHATRFLHPAIDIRKRGPATAVAGGRLTYTLDVTNPGDVSLGGVVVTDGRCAAAPTRQSVNGDATPETLEPGDHWSYTCQVQTQAGQTSVVNAADVRGTDEHDRTVTDEDTFTTTLTQPRAPVPPTTTTARTPDPVVAPGQQVAGAQQASIARRGTAALRGPSACPRTSTVSASVTGRQIRRVTFFVAGKRVKTVTTADSRGRFTLTLRTASLRRGATPVVAQVQFTTASRTKTRSLRITITRCAAQVVRPHFTG